MSKQEIEVLVQTLGNIRHVLADADPDDQAEVYRQLGLRLTYHPAKRLVRAEAHLDPHSWGYGPCRRSDLHTNHTPRAVDGVTEGPRRCCRSYLVGCFRCLLS